MVVLKVIGIAFLFVMTWILGFTIGISEDCIADRAFEIEMGEGWLIRPVKHFLCGAFKGHKWEPCGKPVPPVGEGRQDIRCKLCGKVKTVRCMSKEVSE